MPTPARLDAVIDRMRRTREYTRQYLPDLTPEEWFWSPPSYTTHIAWQVAHIAVSQYNLCLRRLRGRTAEDDSLVSEDFVNSFKIGSQPIAGSKANPPLAEIQRVFDAVHHQILTELPLVDDAELDAPSEPPHPRFKTKLGGIDYASQHELVHAGQIAMLRRLMGKAPLR
jgi:hypothetical protein